MNSPLMAALQQFDMSEANLGKLERLWGEIQSLIPQGVVFGDNPEYEDRCRSFAEVLVALPLIDGWKPSISLPDLNEIAQNRFDAMDLGEIEATISVETAIAAPGNDIREYRFRFNQKRRALIRDTLVNLIDNIDADLRAVRQGTGEMQQPFEKISGMHWDSLREHVAQIDVLLGSAARPPRWGEMRRHLGFGQHQDLIDIEKLDWPHVKAGLRKNLYGENEPLPVTVPDLADLVAEKPRGEVGVKLSWSTLDDESFERLMFTLISTSDGYENPEWLMRTHAPDRGRDLSVMRVTVDRLAGTRRRRVIIQCRHWQTKSVGVADVIMVKEQMTLWGTPRVEVLTVATTGRFTADAVQWVETHNDSGGTPSIEMWPESHLELLLAARPDIVAEFELRHRLQQKIEGLQNQLEEYRCPQCGSELVTREPIDYDEKSSGLVETYECGYQTGGFFERPCPFGPRFPTLEDFDLTVVSQEGEDHFKYVCYATPKTDAARRIRLDDGYGRTEDEAREAVIEHYAYLTTPPCQEFRGKWRSRSGYKRA